MERDSMSMRSMTLPPTHMLPAIRIVARTSSLPSSKYVRSDLYLSVSVCVALAVSISVWQILSELDVKIQSLGNTQAGRSTLQQIFKPCTPINSHDDVLGLTGWLIAGLTNMVCR
jgi:hypothetical protein